MIESGRSHLGRKIGHYVVVAPIAEGGMGTVLLGFDETLHRRVALKVLRGELRLDADAKARFLREARVLSQLKHPNVCVVHDYLEAADEDFIVLELVDGRNLTRALREGLADGDKVRIALQLAAVLEAVHGQGLVHRDLKPDNVMLQPEGDIKVLDFGLARPVEEATVALPAADPPRAVVVDPAGERDGTAGRDGHVHTRLGTVMGTLGYMSPEQARGEPITAASDLYAFGLILQELFTGQPAFERRRPVEELLADAARGARRPMPGVEPPLAQLVEELTRLRPEERIDAREARRRLGWIAAAPERRRRRRVAAAGIAVAAAAVAAAGWLAYRLNAETPLVPAGARGRVALVAFVNATGDAGLDWIEHGLRGMVAETLEELDTVDVVPAARVDRAAGQLAESPGALGDDDLSRLAGLLGAEVAVAVRFSTATPECRLEYRAATRAGAVGKRRVTAADPMAAGEELAARLVRRLAPERPFVGLRERFSEDPLANRLYAMGMAAWQRESAEAARDLLRAALRVDPDLDWARIGLADAADRMADWDEEERLAREVRARAGERGDARLVAASLTRLASVALHRLDFGAAESLARESLDGARRRGDVEREAEALFQLGDVALARESWTDAERYYGESLERHRRLGDKVAEISSLHAVGASLTGQLERLELAASTLERAIALERELGLRPFEAMSLNSLGIVRMKQGRLDESTALFEGALEIYRATGNRRMVAGTLGNLAVVEQNRGRWGKAIALLEESHAVGVELADDEMRTMHAFNLAFAYARTGQAPLARRYLEEARVRYGDDWEIQWIDARLAWLAGEPERARRLAAAARARAGAGFEPGFDGAALTDSVALE